VQLALWGGKDENYVWKTKCCNNNKIEKTGNAGPLVRMMR
jgi:hypothetical protein